MGSRTTPDGDDQGSGAPTRRSAKQLQQNAITRSRARARAGRTELVDQDRLDGPSEVEIDLTPAAVRRPRDGGLPSRSEPRHRKVWGAAIATALVLLVPGTTLLSPSTPVVDGALNSNFGNLYGTTPTLDGTTQDALVPAPEPDTRDEHKNLTKPKHTSAPAAPNASAAPNPAPSTASAPAPVAKPSPTPAPERKPAPKPETNATSSGGGDVSSASSGLPWASGAFIPGDNVSELKQFGRWRGRGVDAVVTYTARQSWDDMTNADWLWDTYKNTKLTVVVGIPPFPENSGSTLSACASGAYDEKWQAIARKLKGTGYSNRIVVRLGWEFNGDWYDWKATDPDAFAACWRQVVGTAEEIAPAVKWDWNVNRGSSKGLADAKQAWPGAKYVDIVGIDSYDWYPGVRSEADWQEQVTGDQGLNYWLSFARSQGKKISFPEWGLYPGAGGVSGGDNPFYIKKMTGYFKAHAADLAYESYFNEPDGYIASSIFGDVQNPSAANEYKDVYGAG